MSRTPSGGLKALTNSSAIVGTSVNATIKGLSLVTTCSGLQCRKCEFLQENCVSCTSKTDTLTLSDDFIVGICGGLTIENNKIVDEPEKTAGCENSGGLPVPHARILKPQAWSNCGNGKRYLKVGFVLTSRLLRSIYNGNLAHARTAIVGMLEEVNLIYEPQLRVRLVIGEVYSLEDPKRNPKPKCGTGWNSASSIRSALDSFTSWAACVNQDHVGIWHLIDVQPGRYGAGEAYVGTMCRTTLNTGVSIYSSQLWRTVAHEIGHNFNARHPTVDGVVARENAGIMGYGDAKYKNEYQFDDGNKQHICSKLRSVDGDCAALKTTHSATCGNGIREAGEECECPSGTSCPCCENCKLREKAECNPSEQYPGCCSAQCKFESMAKTCDGGDGYCKRGSCINPFPILQLCGVNEETCRVGLSNGGRCIFNGFLSAGKSLHIVEDGTICKNRGTCRGGVCKDQKSTDSADEGITRTTSRPSPTPFPSNYPTSFPTVRKPSSQVICQKSRKSCEELPGFIYSGEHKEVCAKSIDLTSHKECHTQIGFYDADKVCKDLGARLCTAEELTDRVAENTGCELNTKHIWSSTPCGNGRHYAVRRQRYTSKLCVPGGTSRYRSRRLGLRCCADRNISC